MFFFYLRGNISNCLKHPKTKQHARLLELKQEDLEIKIGEELSKGNSILGEVSSIFSKDKSEFVFMVALDP